MTIEFNPRDPTKLVVGGLRGRAVSTRSAVSTDRTRRRAFVEELATWGFKGELRRTGDERNVKGEVLWGVS